MFKTKRRVYLDYAAATPLDRDIEKKMIPYWSKYFGNAGGLHKEGRIARKAVTDARKKIAHAIKVQAEEVIFTASGTESNNLAIFGFMNKLKEEKGSVEEVHAISSSAEHPSVLDCFKTLEKEGLMVSYIDFNKEGMVEPKDVEALLTPKTRFLSIAYVNNEIGTIQPIKEISRKIKAYGKKERINILFHTDASQAPLYLDCTPHILGVDLMTIDAQKIYGPKGIGFLYKKKEVALSSVIKGGNQEFTLRAGTENTPLIVGMAESFARAASSSCSSAARRS